MIENGQTRLRKYWDLNYPLRDEVGYREDENYYVESLRERLFASVKRRLQADVEVGFYLSGGLDSSLIAATIHQVSPGISRHSFSIAFHEKDITETKYQRLIARKLETVHHEIVVDREQILSNLLGMLYYCEAPVKETYNTCCLALSKAARNNGVSVVLTGEGADELFAGYPGYRFDGFGFRPSRATPLEAAIEEELRTKVWGDHNFFYEGSLSELREIKTAFYSEALSRRLEDFDCFNHPLIDRDQLRGRHEIHKRAYLDFYLRLSDHLITDHGDRMAMANSVEARYPFLDIDLIEFSLLIPPNLKLNGLTEKYILKKAAQGLTPQEIIQREKFGFHAPGTPYLLQAKLEWIWDLLSCERIRKDGYFNPQVIESLKKQYSKPGFKLNLPYETDYLMIVLSFNLLLDIFRLPRLN
jgi:asparagine synthase (glutamine-hydrolysing)